MAGNFYQRSGVQAGKLVGSITRRQSRWGALTVGGAVGQDNAVIPKSEPFFDLDHGWKTGESGCVGGVEFSYTQHWYWYQSARILPLTGTTLVYFPQNWTFTLGTTGSRSVSRNECGMAAIGNRAARISRRTLGRPKAFRECFLCSGHRELRHRGPNRRIVEAMALDAFEAAGPAESARLLQFMRTSGLIEKRIFEAQHLTGWRRMRALVALGRTRAPEGVPALAEALRGLGRTACPQAAEEILAWVGESGLTVPALPLQSALIQCCAERPQLLLPYVKQAERPSREILGRVLGEVATPELGLELLQFVGDDGEELRAAAARAMSHTDAAVAFDALSELAEDRTWFVRLRAIIGIGNPADPRAIPTLPKGLTDLVRLVSYCFFEHFPYRQLHMIWRLQGLWQYLRGDLEWKPLKRKGLASTVRAQ